jgi:hypothetical protein
MVCPMRLVVLAFSLAVALAVAAYSFFYMRELRLTLDDGRDERGAPKSLRSRALEFINGRCVRVRARERERGRDEIGRASCRAAALTLAQVPAGRVSLSTWRRWRLRRVGEHRRSGRGSAQLSALPSLMYLVP